MAWVFSAFIGPTKLMRKLAKLTTSEANSREIILLNSRLTVFAGHTALAVLDTCGHLH
jgi:hypothetical protein